MINISMKVVNVVFVVLVLGSFIMNNNVVTILFMILSFFKISKLCSVKK